MEQLVVVTYPEPLTLEARSIPHDHTPQGSIALGYYHRGHLVARSVVAQEAIEAITGILSQPVSVALAAMADEQGNIEARVCLVLPVDPDELLQEDDDEPEEPWRASVPPPPIEVESDYAAPPEDRPKLALLPIGNVVRNATQRHHNDVAGDAREMLENLLAGRGRDAVQRAIDDLLDSI